MLAVMKVMMMLIMPWKKHEWIDKDISNTSIDQTIPPHTATMIQTIVPIFRFYQIFIDKYQGNMISIINDKKKT